MPLQPGDPRESNIAIIFRGIQMSANEYSVIEVCYEKVRNCLAAREKEARRKCHLQRFRRESVKEVIRHHPRRFNGYSNRIASQIEKIDVINHIIQRIFVCGHLYASENDRYVGSCRIPRSKRHQHPPKRGSGWRRTPLFFVGEILNHGG